MVHEKEKISFEELNLSNMKILVNLQNNTNLEKWNFSEVRHLLKKGSGQGLILYKFFMPIGFCLYRNLIDEAEILYIGVLKEYRRKGLGRFMIIELERIFSDKKIVKCFLEVNESNKPALKFYSKIGFSFIKTLNNYYKQKNYSENGLLLQKLYN